MKHIAIIGSGISGLATAWFLKKQSKVPFKLTVIEKAPLPGGWIQTRQYSEFICEFGPRGFIPHGKGLTTLELCHQLGLDDELLIASGNFKKRFLYVQNKLQALPSNPIEMLCSSLLRPHLIRLWKERKIPIYEEEESVLDFFNRRFGLSFTNTFIDPIISGIFAGKLSELSLSACFPSIKKMELEYGSIIVGLLKQKKTKKGSLVSFKNGMQTLPNKIFERLKDDVNFLFSHCVNKILLKQNHIEIEHHNGIVNADFVVLATDPSLLSDPFEKPIIPRASLATVHLGFRDRALKNEGFGYLIPSQENQKILGATWDSHIFNRTQNSHLCVMMGGRNFPDICELSDEHLSQIAINSIKQHLNIGENPYFIQVGRAINAVPQYVVGHEKKMEQLHQNIRSHTHRLFLTGNYLTGVGINDCVDHAFKLSQQLCALLAHEKLCPQTHSNVEQ